MAGARIEGAVAESAPREGLAVHDATARQPSPERPPLELPPVSIPDDLPSDPSFSVLVELARKPDSMDPLAERYFGAVAALEQGDARTALRELRSVIAADAQWRLPSAKVLACLLGVQLGDFA